MYYITRSGAKVDGLAYASREHAKVGVRERVTEEWVKAHGEKPSPEKVAELEKEYGVLEQRVE